MKKIKFLVVLIAVMVIGGMSSKVDAASNSMLVLSGTNTTCNIYAKPDGKQVLTYTNPLYQRDVPLLATSGSYYKIMISGVEGWIKKGGACFNGAGAKVKSVSSLDTYSFTTGGKKLSGLDVSRYQVVGSKMYFGLVYGNYITYNIGYTDVPKGLANNKVYYSYDGVYYYANYNTMISDYKAKTRKNSTNYANPYYDFYQNVPIRSTSKVTSTALNKRLVQKQSNAATKLKETKTFYQSCNGTKKFTSAYNYYISAVYNKGSVFTSKQSSYNVNAGALYGIMLNESANGTSNLSRHYNNPFGWGAVDSCPNSATRYSSMDTAIATYYKNMSNTYANPISHGGHGTQLGNKKAGANVKYASDPQWGYKNAYNYRIIDELAGNKDKNRFKLGIINSGASATDSTLSKEYTKVYSSASTSAKSPYYYEKNGSAVIIQGESGSFYKIQNDSSTSGGSVYIQKSKVYVVNSGTGSSIGTTPVKVNYEKSGSNHYVWGKNNVGQLGNGKTSTVASTAKINLNSYLPKGETIKSVTLYNNTNIYILTNLGNVYSSGSNTYGQRSYTSKANRFNKVNPFNDKIKAIKISDNRLRMQRVKNTSEYYFVGNKGFNPTTKAYTRKTSYPVLVRFNKSNVATQARLYNYARSKTSGLYIYSGNLLAKRTVYSYNSSRQLTSLTYTKYSKKKKTYNKKLNYSKGKITLKTEHYYVNGKLKSTSKKAVRYVTYYSNGKAKKTYKRVYSKSGKLGKSVRVNVRK